MDWPICLHYIQDTERNNYYKLSIYLSVNSRKIFNCWICWIRFKVFNIKWLYINPEKECWSCFVMTRTNYVFNCLFINIPHYLNVFMHNGSVFHILHYFMLLICKRVFDINLCSFFMCVFYICTLSENDKIKLFNQSITHQFIVTSVLHIFIAELSHRLNNRLPPACHPSQYLKQSGLLLNLTLRNRLKWKNSRKSAIYWRNWTYDYHLQVCHQSNSR